MPDIDDASTGDPLEPLPVKATRLLLEANKALTTKHYEIATQLYSVVSQLYAEMYGQVSPKCAPVLFNYGRALLNNAIEKSGILGDEGQVKNATGKREKDLLSVVDESITSVLASAKNASHFVFNGDEEDDEEAVDETDQKTENESTAVSDTTTPHIDNGNVDTHVVNGYSTTLDDSSVQDSSKPAQEDEEEEEDDEDDDNEEGDIDDFQIAFEVLDVARIIYRQMLDGLLPLELDTDMDELIASSVQTKSTFVDDKGKLKTDDMNGRADKLVQVRYRLAEVCSTLGDVSLESESFGQAIEDYSLALSMKIDLLDPSNRQLAELHYKLALAIEYSNQGLDRVIEHMKSARGIMIARKAILEKTRQRSNSGNMNAATQVSDTAITTEIDEIDELLPDLNIKLEDLQGQKDGQNTLLEDESSRAAVTIARANLDTAVVNDLSMLVKKKSKITSPDTTTTLSTPIVLTTIEEDRTSHDPLSPKKRKAESSLADDCKVEESVPEKKIKVDQ